MYTLKDLKNLSIKPIIYIDNEEFHDVFKKEGFNITFDFYKAAYYSLKTGTWASYHTDYDHSFTLIKINEIVDFNPQFNNLILAL